MPFKRQRLCPFGWLCEHAKCCRGQQQSKQRAVHSYDGAAHLTYQSREDTTSLPAAELPDETECSTMPQVAIQVPWTAVFLQTMRTFQCGACRSMFCRPENVLAKSPSWTLPPAGQNTMLRIWNENSVSQDLCALGRCCPLTAWRTSLATRCTACLSVCSPSCAAQQPTKVPH